MRPWDKPEAGNIPPAAEPRAELQSTPEIPNASKEPDAVAAIPPRHFEVSNLVLDFRPSKSRKKWKILILCGGPNDRTVSLYNLFVSAGLECVNYDKVNGQQFDLVDDVVKDEILHDIAAGEYVAAFASPECSTFSKLHNLPGPPPLRTATGPERYGIKTNNIEQAEKVRIHTLMAVRVAQALDLLTELRIPWLYETPAIHAGQVSMAHLDEYVALLKKDGVQHTIGLQCPFGGPSPKPTSWIFYRMELDGMPTKCEHVKRTWHNNRTGAITFSRHMPTAGKDTHSLTAQSSTSFGVRRVTPWDSEVTSPYVSESLAAYPDLLNRFIVAKISKAIYTVHQSGPIFARPNPEQPAAKAHAAFKETLQWRDPLKGLLEPTDKDKADDASIGGLRNTSDALSKLSFTAAYGLKLGECLKKNFGRAPRVDRPDLQCNWYQRRRTRSSRPEPLRPPPEAIAEIRRLITEYVADTIPPKVTAKRTDVDAHLLEGWRSAAKDPESEMFEWLTVGGPMGIIHTPKNVGIFPEVEGTPECSPDAISCNMATFRNYPGVEDQAITGDEMKKHIDKESSRGIRHP